ncbi:hypothetical protein DFH28DRAFT_899163 [Melampsora americana]|nr:hypothetical protein DFH28DRAFT_899163 [Melampsora americana]
MPRTRRKVGGNITNVKEERKKRQKKADPAGEAQAEAKFMKNVQDAQQFLRGAAHHPDELDVEPPVGDHEEPHMEGFLPMDGNGGDRAPDRDDEWVDVEGFNRDGAIRRFVQKHRGYVYAAQRESLRNQWEALETQITAAYLENEALTSNWTTKTSYLGAVSPDCQCAADVLYSWTVDLIDLVGYIASSPKESRTAFSIPLLQHHHELWLTSVTASKDRPDESQYPSLFIKPSKIAQKDVRLTAARATGNAEGAEDSCSEAHKTANDTRNSSTWDKCDDTGLFATACRHDVPLVMANIYQSGEKMYYPLSVMKHIMDDFPTQRFGVLYDIGCHLDKHIKLVCFSFSHIIYTMCSVDTLRLTQ